MDYLRTPAVHRLLTAPVGRVFTSRIFESYKARSLPADFGVTRARAAADVALGSGPNTYLKEVGAPPAPSLDRRITHALAQYADIREAYDATMAKWNDVFWEDYESLPDERVALERERRECAHQHAKPTDVFGFLTSEHYVPPVKFETPDAETARTRWRHELAEPERLYGFSEMRTAEQVPRVERSATVRGPNTTEYVLRFPSPAAHLGDMATARVYEPADGDDSLPTLVYHSGWGSLNDQGTYWPEEEALGRTLSPRGFRVILPDAPWHGRRERPGFYSGEPYIARVPEGMFTLYAGAALETAVLTDWARTEGAPAVGVGGTSLGGTIALHVAGWCDYWPESMRPDRLFVVGAPGSITQTIPSSDLTPMLGLDSALDVAGWNGEALREFAPLLNPPSEPALDPSKIFTFSGRRDRMAPFATTRTLIEQWGVPARNQVEWNCGHFGVLSNMIRTGGVQRKIRRQLDDASREKERIAA
ncbi:alpha/beta hydrolase [Haloferax namakaokahaiae]|uniref:Alpha/beta hydrolase n=1 Tax=Haloferax namakaokahaiae TaxID=1748331 RepID=A0ABD5ZER7_9EURY